ncbi:RecBCD enzyme subunit RecB [Alishewanella longhuensis]|uniref:RecBCD enzyme subunit RecB n=1 Tax=Alishewanella longhuensis TaxID=1091037 RepID=A0ABQ3L296_9ALTE|nr:exodeoxyribonuclease V subunit beta [Alishewanella longhuensis]GHG77397.1 RecBCD enzyme subunit RecB [Alishewanella longhuensis]
MSAISGTVNSTILNSPLQLPLTGSVLIEASAGTGKTFTIAALYVRFILAHLPRLAAPATRNTALLPADILVVTFTKAATAELKDRIRKRLVQAAAVFRDSDPLEDSVLTALKAEFATELWPECAYALQMASEAMDEASVKTIHSWCQSVLREHAFSSGSLFSQQLITDLAPYKLEAVRDYWRNFFYPLPAQLYQRVTELVATPDALLSEINGLWDLAPPACQPLHMAQLIDAAEQRQQQKLAEAKHRWQLLLPRYFALIDEAEKQGWFTKPKTHNGSKARKDFAALSDWLALATGAKTAVDESLPVLKDSLIKNYGKEFTLHYTGPALSEDLPGALLALQQLLQQKADLRPDLLAHAVSWCKARFEQQLARDAVLGFNDIIQHTRRALTTEQGEALSAILRQQYPVALIDEFQDTDPDQYHIFNTVYQIAANRQDLAVFLIGDPKQAIYAFRGADIYTYLQARRDTEGRHFTLATNFRSSEAMVKGANAIFIPAEKNTFAKAFLFNDARGNQVPFVEVAAKGVDRNLIINGKPAETAMQLWTATFAQLSDGGDDSKDISKSLYRQSMASRFSDYIALLLNQAVAGKTGFQHTAAASKTLSPLQSKDIAILVATHNEGHLMQRELRKRGLASVYLSDRNSVFDTEVARDLLLLLTACAEPANKRALLNALYTRLLNLSLPELDALQHDDMQWDNRVGQFYQFAASWQQQGVLAMIRQIMQQFKVAERLLAKTADANGNSVAGERYLTDLLHLAELLQQAAAKLEGPQALLRFLHEHIYQRDNVQQPADEQVVRLESDAELIQIVTIHKSKGLEYPLVFLPFISLCRPVSVKDKVFNYHTSDGLPCQSIVAEPTILQQADQERLGEDIRKLYVAVTRAKYACWLSLAPTGDWPKSALAYLLDATTAADGKQFLARATTLFAGQPLSVAPLPSFAETQHYQAKEKTSELQQFSACQMPAGHRFSPWWVASYSALKYGALREPDSPQEHNLLDEQEDEVAVQAAAVSLHELPRGAGPGTFLHNLLQDAAEAGFAQVAKDAELRGALLARRCRHGSWAARRELLDAWLASYLQTAFMLADGKAVRLAELNLYKAEPEFWFAVSGVSTVQLDDLVSRAVLPGYTRPGLQANYLNGMLKGFIDLLFEYEGRYYVADYKSNYLGPDNSAYSQGAMRDKILASRYDMQYVLYTLALHKLLKARLQQQYCYDKHIGGVLYLFLRGQHAATAGAFSDKPPRELIEQLDQLLASGQEAGEATDASI